MVSTTRSRPNHYETLGLKPTATNEEIRQAFAREISLTRPKAFGDLAQVSVAHETLRDPIKRKAYDVSLGLGSKPAPRQPLTARPGASFLVPAWAEPLVRPAVAPAAQPAPRASTEPRQEPVADRTPGSFIAASLRAPANPSARISSQVPRPEPEPTRQPKPKLPPQVAKKPEPIASAKPVTVPDVGTHWGAVEVSAIHWKQTGMMGGGLVVGVALIGAIAGWWSGREVEEPPKPETSATISLPPATPLPLPAAQARGQNQRANQARPEAPTRPVAAVRVERAIPPQAEVAPRPQIVPFEQVRPEETSFVDAAAAEGSPAVASETPPVTAASAKLPLPPRVIARTIQRIGYACGQVASTSAIESGAPGAFKVTCTSGHSYRAAPVGGRYHFRKWGRD